MEKGVRARRVRRYSQGALSAEVEDAIAVEEPLELRVDEEPVAITMRTPGNDAELALGFLFAEGIVESSADVGSLFHCGRPGEEGYGNALEVKPASGAHFELERLQASRRGTLTTTACGVCGRRSVDDLLALVGPVPMRPPIPAATILSCAEQLRTVQANFARTGGVHAAAAFDASGALLCGFEDVGRHNAVDKVVGELLRRGLVARRKRVLERSEAAVLAVSGRASFELVQKAAMAGIGVLTSVSAASTLAIDLAAKAQIALCSFTRGGGFNLYGAGERVSV